MAPAMIDGDVVDLAHGVADLADRFDGIAGRGLDHADDLGDFGGGLGEQQRSARLRSLPPTTAKPRPASPARAASMVAFSARRLVCSAIAWIRVSTPSMRWVAAARPSISATDLSVRRPACSTALAD